MSAATTDKLDRVTDSSTGRPVLSQLATPGKSVGASAITCTDLTNWTTSSKVHFSIYNTTSAGVKDPTTQTDWTGIVVGNTITSLTLTGGTDRVYNPGAIVDATPTAAWAKDLYDNISSFANQNGTLQTAAVQAALNLGNTPAAGWTPLGTTFTYTGNNGNKEFTLTAPIDLTTTLSRGMKIQFTRSTVPPTQCMAFAAASSQYATKASPSNVAFTSAFTCEAWVYLVSYGSTQGSSVIGRTDATTGGFQLRLNSSGQVSVYYAASSAFTEWTSYQIVPLNRWVHIAASVSSVSSKTLQGIYINGGSVVAVNGNQNTTALTQTGNLSVGAAGAATANSFLNGYIAEARIWGVAQTQAQVQANMGISLTGSETNLVALFQGNGNFNDKTTNANNLTANGGASATQTFASINGGTTNEPTAAPMNTVEYGLVTDVSIFTGGVTTIKVFCGTDYCIPNGGLTGSQYSNARAPFGFPASKGKWVVDFLNSLNQSMAVSANTWTNGNGQQITVPSGEWVLSFQGNFISALNGTFVSMKVALSTANNTNSEVRLQGQLGGFSQSTTQIGGPIARSLAISQAALSIWYLNLYSSGAGTTLYYAGSDAPILIQAESAYI